MKIDEFNEMTVDQRVAAVAAEANFDRDRLDCGACIAQLPAGTGMERLRWLRLGAGEGYLRQEDKHRAPMYGKENCYVCQEQERPMLSVGAYSLWYPPVRHFCSQQCFLAWIVQIGRAQLERTIP